MNAYRAEGGVVVEVILTNGDVPSGFLAVPAGQTANIGDTLSDGVFTRPSVSVVAEIPIISPLQCKRQAVAEGLWDTLKPAIETAGLWEDFILSKLIERDSTEAATLRSALQKTDTEMDAFFQNAARR